MLSFTLFKQNTCLSSSPFRVNCCEIYLNFTVKFTPECQLADDIDHFLFLMIII